MTITSFKPVIFLPKIFRQIYDRLTKQTKTYSI